MSEKKSESAILLKGLIKSVEETNKGLNELTTIIAGSEQRHIAHMEKSERLEESIIEQGKESKKYRKSNDDRVMDIEKQVLLLDSSVSKDDEIRDKKEERKNKIKDYVIGSLAVLFILAVLKIAIPVNENNGNDHEAKQNQR